LLPKLLLIELPHAAIQKAISKAAQTVDKRPKGSDRHTARPRGDTQPLLKLDAVGTIR